MKKVVRESLGDILKPKSEEDIEFSVEQRISEFETMDPKEIVDSISDEFYVGHLDVAIFILNNVDPKERSEAIEIVYRDYVDKRKVSKGIPR